VSGQLKHLYVKLADKVTQGQLLAVIDAQQAESRIREVNAILQDLNAQLRQGLAERRLTKLTLDRQHTLAKLHVISQNELDKASTELEVKNARLETIKAEIDKTIASLESAKINLDYTKITAPMGGNCSNHYPREPNCHCCTTGSHYFNLSRYANHVSQCASF